MCRQRAPPYLFSNSVPPVIVSAALAVLDKPAATWDSEPLDRLYRDLRTMLEIDDRFRALEHKLRAVQDTLEVLLELNTNRRAHLLELTIVLLILFEIVLTVFTMVTGIGR